MSLFFSIFDQWFIQLIHFFSTFNFNSHSTHSHSFQLLNGSPLHSLVLGGPSRSRSRSLLWSNPFPVGLVRGAPSPWGGNAPLGGYAPWGWSPRSVPLNGSLKSPSFMDFIFYWFHLRQQYFKVKQVHIKVIVKKLKAIQMGSCSNIEWKSSKNPFI